MIRNTALALAGLLVSQTLQANTASPRIVGGKDAETGWKTLVALIDKPTKQSAVNNQNDYPVFQAQFCGGTLLSKQWVLTAAHCVTGVSSSNLEIMVGSHTLGISPDSSQLKDVASIHIHPNYSNATNRNDIALIRLAEEANPELSSVSTAVLALASTDTELETNFNPDDVFTALGWGVVTYENPGMTPVYTLDLQEVGLDYLTNSTCQSLYNSNAKSETIFGSMLCANEPTPDDEGDTFGEDSCQGDSGGPLFITDSPLNDSPQAGITSFGYECGNFEIPGVYTRVSQFTNWIEQNTNSGNAPLRNLSIGENARSNQGVSSFPVNIPIKNSGNLSATNFTVAINHSKSISLSVAPEESGLICNTVRDDLTECDYTGAGILGNITRELALTANDSAGRTTGSDNLSVTVTLDDYRDYHRLDDRGAVPIYFGKPLLSISAQPFCLNSGDSTVQMRVEATLTNSSSQIYSEDTLVTGMLPENVELFGKASPNCSTEGELFTCNIGQLDANSEVSAIIGLTASPETLETINLEIDNSNGLAVGSTLSSNIELNFSREDLPACPAIPSSATNLTNRSGGGGGGSTGLFTLASLLIVMTRKRKQ